MLPKWISMLKCFFLSMCVCVCGCVYQLFSLCLFVSCLLGVRLTWWSHAVGDAVLRQVSHRAMLWASYWNKDMFRSSPLPLSSAAVLTAASSPCPPSLPCLHLIAQPRLTFPPHSPVSLLFSHHRLVHITAPFFFFLTTLDSGRFVASNLNS